MNDPMSGKGTLNNLNAYTSIRPEIVALIPDDAFHVLDVGCSNGALGAALRAMVPNRIVEGIEYNQELYLEAIGKLNRVIQADLNNFNWKENYSGQIFDCMIFADVLEHLVDPWKVLGEALEYLRPDGIAIISVPNIRHITSLYSIFLRGVFPRNTRGLFDRTHLRWFTSSDARHLLESNGLVVVSLTAMLRINDIPNTSLNRFVERHMSDFGSWAWVREFLGYQLVLVGSKLKNGE